MVYLKIFTQRWFTFVAHITFLLDSTLLYNRKPAQQTLWARGWMKFKRLCTNGV